MIFFFILGASAQSNQRIVLKGEYSFSDSAHVMESFGRARAAVDSMYRAMELIWNVERSIEDRDSARRQNWNERPAFETWLGEPIYMGTVHRRIKRIYSKFNKRIIFKITKQNKGRCIGWISAWTLPFGKVNIRLCEDFFVYRTHLQEKIIIHEMGHEIGMLSHHRIHGCRSALRAAASGKRNKAIRSPENYAWLAMNYIGLGCHN